MLAHNSGHEPAHNTSRRSGHPGISPQWRCRNLHVTCQRCSRYQATSPGITTVRVMQLQHAAPGSVTELPMWHVLGQAAVVAPPGFFAASAGTPGSAQQAAASPSLTSLSESVKTHPLCSESTAGSSLGRAGRAASASGCCSTGCSGEGAAGCNGTAGALGSGSSPSRQESCDGLPLVMGSCDELAGRPFDSASASASGGSKAGISEKLPELLEETSHLASTPVVAAAVTPI